MLHTHGIFGVIFFLSLTSQALSAQLPNSEKELPIFPVTVRDRGLECELRLAEPSRPAAHGWESVPIAKRSSAHLVFNSGMYAEEVFTFYLQAFGVVFHEGPIPPLERLSFHTEESLDSCDEKSPQWIKARERMESRRPFRSGKWLEYASFSWVVEELNGDFSELNLHIHDVSFACSQENSPPKHTGTQIRFSRVTWQEL